MKNRKKVSKRKFRRVMRETFEYVIGTPIFCNDTTLFCNDIDTRCNGERI